MISERAKAGFDRVVEKSMRKALAGPDDTVTEVMRVPSLAEIDESRAVMLSVSSYTFRLMLFVHFEPNLATRNHFARLHGMDPSGMNDSSFTDAIAECGNLFCGTLNRELGQAFAHIGMSTPNVLRRECLAHMGLLRVGHSLHLRMKLNGDTTFHATLYVSDYGDIDFELADEAQAEASGELEFF